VTPRSPSKRTWTTPSCSSPKTRAWENGAFSFTSLCHVKRSNPIPIFAPHAPQDTQSFISHVNSVSHGGRGDLYWLVPGRPVPYPGGWHGDSCSPAQPIVLTPLVTPPFASAKASAGSLDDWDEYFGTPACARRPSRPLAVHGQVVTPVVSHKQEVKILHSEHSSSW
jgi:hypothetical protein